MLIIRFGGNAKKGINGELQSIAGPMVQDVHIVWERLLLKPTLLLENIEQRCIIKILGKSSISYWGLLCMQVYIFWQEVEMEKVLIITSSIDNTVDYIMNNYDGVAEFYRLDVDMFPKYEIVLGGSRQWVISCDEWSLEKKELHSIYYRKPRLPNLDEYSDAYKGMIAKDIISLINGMVDDFQGRVLTKPYILRKTENKAFQLLYAEKKGLFIPKSFVGNSNRRAKDFFNKKSIIKPLTTGKIAVGNVVELYHTSYLGASDEDISLTPVYFQEYINKQYEVRMTYIDGCFFTVRIDSEDKLDWRRNYRGLKYEIIDCPPNISGQCKGLLKDFRLNYGAFDFIVDENDRWCFLEINPNGQWLWLEHELQMPISEKIIGYLVG